MKVPNNDKGDKNLLGWGKYILNDWVARTGNGELFKAQQHLGKENICRLEPIIKKSYEMDDLTVLDTVTEIWNDYYKTVKNDVIKFILNKYFYFFLKILVLLVPLWLEKIMASSILS